VISELLKINIYVKDCVQYLVISVHIAIVFPFNFTLLEDNLQTSQNTVMVLPSGGRLEGLGQVAACGCGAAALLHWWLGTAASRSLEQKRVAACGRGHGRRRGVGWGEAKGDRRH
jgi:hypothetical protein